MVDESAETAILVISRASGENYDNGAFRGEYYLTEEEEQQIASLKEKYKNIIAIINSGYPMDIRWTKDPQVKAVIWTGFSGMLGGQALVNILNHPDTSRIHGRMITMIFHPVRTFSCRIPRRERWMPTTMCG
mgnify:CR=1 FL=1